MIQVSAVSGYGIPVQRRRSRRWAIRAGLVGMVLVAIAYAALPLWLPRSWLAHRVVDQLSADLNRPVRIGGVRIGWISGLVLEDVAIAERPGLPNALLARASRVRCDFRPVTILLTGKVNQIEFDSPQVWLVFDEQGRLKNLADLGPKPGRRLPSRNYVIRQAACHVMTPLATQTFKIDTLQCELERATGLLRLFGQAVVSRSGAVAEPVSMGRLTTDARVTVPRLKRDETLHGHVRMEWNDLSLTDLPLPLVTRLPIEQVDGTTTGQLILAAHPDLGIDYDLFIVFNGVRVVRRGFDQPGQVPDAELHCEGHWDPNTDTVLMRDFDYRTQAIHVGRASGTDAPAVLIDPKGDTPFALHLAGEIKDWLALRREFPEVDVFARAVKATFTGRAEVAIAFTQKHEEDRLALTVDGRQSRWVIAGAPAPYLSAAAGVPKRFHVEVSRDRRTGRLSRPDVSLSLGDLSLAARCRATLPAPEAAARDTLQWLVDALPALHGDLTIETAHVEQAVAMLPFLGRLTGVSNWRGPLLLRAFITPADGFSRLQLGAAMSPETSLALGDAFDKPPGRELSITAGVRVPHRDTGRLDGFSFEVAHGNSRISLDQENTRLQYSLAFLDHPRPGFLDGAEPIDRPIAIDAEWEIPLRVEHVEGLLPLFPWWRRLRQAGYPRDLSGSVDLAIHNRVSYRPDDWLVQSEAGIVADDLAIQWDEYLDKPVDAPLAVALTHRFHLVGSEREQSLTAAFHQPAGELTGSIVFTGLDSADPGDDFEHATIRADIREVEDFLATTPGLKNRLASFQPGGAVAVDIESLLIGGWHTVSVSTDLTGAAFVIPGSEPVSKPAGIAAELGFQWHRDRADPWEDEQRWELTEGFVHLGGARVTGLGGLVVTGWEPATSGPAMSARRVVDRQARTPILKSATLDARGEITFDGSLARLHPQLAKWRQALDLSGTADWEIQARLEPDALALTGRIDAGGMNLSLELDNRIAAAVHKPPGTPASVTFDLAASRQPDAGGRRIDCENLALDVDRNTVATNGWLRLSRGPSTSLELADLVLTTNVCLNRPDNVLALLTDSPIDLVEGSAAANVEVRRSEDRLTAGPAELDFDRLAIGFGDDPIHLDGRVTFDDAYAEIGQLRWAWGRSGGVVSGRLHRRQADGRITAGRIGLSLDHLDVKDLCRCFASLPAARSSTTQPVSPATPTVATRLIDRLREADLSVDAYIGTLELSLPLNVDVLADAVAKKTTVVNGQMQLAFSGLVDGGSVTGRLTSNLSVRDPTFHLTYTASRIQPGAVVDRYLALTFPGMKADGPLTLIDESYQRLLPAEDDPNYEVGKGELIIEGGTVEGRAAPLWMTSIFPGLNLARFNFSYMHSWFEKLPTGRIRHQMIFQGALYNIYMVGYSDADRQMKYEVGIDFLADFDSRYWAETGQGRIPLFIKTGRILPDGTLADERVAYVPRRFIESLLLGNNPLVTAYLAVRQQVLGKE